MTEWALLDQDSVSVREMIFLMEQIYFVDYRERLLWRSSVAFLGHMVLYTSQEF